METGTVFASNTVMLYKKCFCSEKINKIYNDILFKRISLESGTQQIILCIYDFPQNFFSKEINPDVKSAVIISSGIFIQNRCFPLIWTRLFPIW